jgi:hypothetical protein
VRGDDSGLIPTAIGMVVPSATAPSQCNVADVSRPQRTDACSGMRVNPSTRNTSWVSCSDISRAISIDSQARGFSSPALKRSSSANAAAGASDGNCCRTASNAGR